MKTVLTFLATLLSPLTLSFFNPVQARRLSFDLGEANWMLEEGSLAREGTSDAFTTGLFPAEPLILGSLAQAEEADRAEGGDDDGRGLPDNFLAFKGGLFWGTDELHDLDETAYIEFAFARYLIARILALELDVGYFFNEENVGGVNVELSGVPMFLNARVGFPILFLEPYAGIGIGGVYIHTDAIDEDDDVVFAGDIYAGLNFNLGRRIFLGLEAKYIITDKTDSGVDLDGVAAMASIGLRL